MFGAVDFQRDIKPILSNHCYQCHGPDAENRKAGLRLDTQQGVLAKGARGTVVVPGNPAESLLIQRAAHAKPALRMPPPYAHKDLSADQVKTLEAWISEGAVWKEHWSLIAPLRPEAPAVAKREWVRNPIDAFVLSRLEQERLTPAKEEDRARLIRRVSLDLRGLPPTPAEVAAFVNDKRSDAYERVVDRFLASEQWGEHRAHYWLDAARYGDTHGLHSDNRREIWPWRDWVIRAFNRNLPYDQFTIEQLAGDLLPNASIEQRIATGFNRNHIATGEGGVIAEEVKAIYIKDQVDTTSTVWLGLTLGCATCHDHKYDPLSQKDFYSFGAFFNNTTEVTTHGEIAEPEPLLIVAPEKDRARLAELEAALPQLRSQFQAATTKADPALTEEIKSKRTALLAQATPPAGDLSLRTPFTVQSRFTYLDNHRVILAAYNGTAFRFQLSVESFLPVVRIEAEGLKTPIAVRGNTYRIPPTSQSMQEISVSWDGSGSPEGVTIYADGRALSCSKVEPVPLALKAGWSSDSKYVRATQLFSRMLSARDVLLSLPEVEKQRLQILTNIEKDPATLELFTKLEALEQERRKIRMRSDVTLVMKEKGGPAVARILKRGQYDQPGDEVSAATPAVLPPMRTDWPRNRLGLAKWIVDESNPLTARVTVNRFWQEVFGTGLVKTAEDFGTTGEPPVHPLLLDWLAVEFRESGWDVKKLFRLMVTSSTYRQAAVSNAEKNTRDPENRLLSRGPRFRMDAEMLRDSALAASGLLDGTIGGPSVRPLQPEGVWEAVAVLYSNTRFYKPDAGAALHRRSLYTFWKRSAPLASLSILNAPAREMCVVRRDRTNTPLQALVTLNDPDFFAAARQLAIEAQRTTASVVGQVDFLGGRILSRKLETVERESALRSHAKLLQHYRANPSEAKQITSRNDFEGAALTVFASQMLNLDEALSK